MDTRKITEKQVSSFGLDRSSLLKFLKLTTSNGVFNFGGRLYSQIDGVAMGSPLGPVLADIFMNFNEIIWLANCPPEFKPLYYRRYVDDTFLIFKNPSHIEPFLNFLNAQHPNIEFTCDTEVDSSLSFLDVLITRQGNTSSQMFTENALSRA